MHQPATLNPGEVVEPRHGPLHINGSLLRLGPVEEAFFKAGTGIQDTEELRKHIIQVHEEAYQVSISHSMLVLSLS